MSTPAALVGGRRPNVFTRRPEPGEIVPNPGTIIWTVDGEALLYVGDSWRDVDVRPLALQLRQARKVTLVGHRGSACRPARGALGWAWTELARAARASRPPALPQAPPQVCGRPKTDGQPCRRPAGWGADPGEEACRDHGGSTALQEAEAERVADQALTFARLTTKARTTPLTPQEQLQAATAIRDVLEARSSRHRRR
ncbi:hypothetical protein ABT186_05180 [Streptomyces sp. NPDC001634]|uniref:hypothetical protein n=1 Tax=Streptomyces sp. NPDC001634 TaxID=3154390 RepID=UPI0033255445